MNPLYIFIGILIFSGLVFSIYKGVTEIIKNTTQPNTTTPQPTTTISQPVIVTTNKPNTTTQPVVTTSKINTTSQPIITTTSTTPISYQPAKTRTNFFQIGQAGTGVLICGGAGGLLINNNGPVSGNGNDYITPAYSTKGGTGGKGYGSGGGASTCCATVNTTGCPPAGNGSPGFIYYVQEDVLFTTNSTYIIQNNYFYNTFILMGGGGCGGYCSAKIPQDVYTFQGGDCGQIVIKQIKGGIKNIQLNINVGRGGYMTGVDNKNLFSYPGGDTSMSFTYNNNLITYTAFGTQPANNNIDSTAVSKYTSLAIGGRFGQNSNGTTIPQTVIDNINSINPTPTT